MKCHGDGHQLGLILGQHFQLPMVLVSAKGCKYYIVKGNFYVSSSVSPSTSALVNRVVRDDDMTILVTPQIGALDYTETSFIISNIY